jgi:hypothetical protein
MTVVRICTLSLVFGATALLLPAQSAAPQTDFVIDPNRGYVYLKFDHIGPGIPRREDEPKNRIWLRIANNCRVPINISENGPPSGSPKDERQIMLEVVPERPRLLRITSPGDQPSEAALQAEGKMPFGYMADVGSSENISPGESILFSIPVNYLSKRWHIEIPYSFELPRGKCCRDPEIGGEVMMVISYSLQDLPPKALVELQQK